MQELVREIKLDHDRVAAAVNVGYVRQGAGRAQKRILATAEIREVAGYSVFRPCRWSKSPAGETIVA